MRLIVQLAAAVALVWVPNATAREAKPTAAADLTRTKALKAKVSAEANNARLGEVLKEFAAQADMGADMLVLWTYGPGFPYSQKVTYTCKDKPIDDALDELLTQAGGGLGYVVVSKDGDRRDGWVLLTTGGERGTPQPAATAEEEATAAQRLALAKKLIDGGKPDSAKPLLTIIVKKYGNTKAAAEAQELLTKLEK